MNRNFLMLLIIISVVLSGCKTYDTTFTVPAPVPLVEAYPATSNTTAIQDSLIIPDTLTVTDALKTVLIKNPELSVYTYEIRAREADVLQASLMPNPEGSYEMENFAGGKDYRGFGGTEITLTAGQLIEVSGKRGKRTEVARLSGELAGWDYQSVKLKVFLETTNAFYEVLTLQQQMVQAVQLQALAEKLEQAVAKRVEAGAMSPAGYSRAKIETEKARVGVQSYRFELEAAKDRLASLWGADKADFKGVKGAIILTDSLPALGNLAFLLKQNPGLARMESEKRLRQAELELQKAQGVPDPFISAGYRRLQETGTNAFVAGVSVPIPFFNRNQGGVRKAAIRLQQMEDMRRAVELSLWKELSLQYGKLLSVTYKARSLGKNIIPQAEKSMQIIMKGYRQGKFTFLDVLDAQRTLFQSYTDYLQALADYRKQVSAIEMLTGQPLLTMNEK
ncbi:MAG: TolC family protein [Bacteroidales bacterium]|nr:TolC family protein [Bacteroidales bacterium]